MKLTKTNHIKASQSGMTLLELTVVILVLLSLISILFIGARAWKRGSDRAASILMIRNVQQAVRSNANMSGLNAADAMDPTDIFGSGKFIETNPTTETHPAGSDFTWTILADSVVPEMGTLYLTVVGATVDDDPAYYMPDDDDILNW